MIEDYPAPKRAGFFNKKKMKFIRYGEESPIVLKDVRLKGILISLKKLTGAVTITLLPEVVITLIRGGVKTIIAEGFIDGLFMGSNQNPNYGAIRTLGLDNTNPLRKITFLVNFWNTYNLTGSDRIDVKFKYPGGYDSGLIIGVEELVSFEAEGSPKVIKYHFADRLATEKVYHTHKNLHSFRFVDHCVITAAGAFDFTLGIAVNSIGLKKFDLSSKECSYSYGEEYINDYLPYTQVMGISVNMNMLPFPIKSPTIKMKFDGVTNVNYFGAFVTVEDLR